MERIKIEAARKTAKIVAALSLIAVGCCGLGYATYIAFGH